MTNENTRHGWSKFNETEVRAISISYQNALNKTDEPTFPYSAVVFEELAVVLAGIAKERPELSAKMIKELTVINERLLKIIPKLGGNPELAPEELQQLLLEQIVCNFIGTQINGIIAQVTMSIEQPQGGEDGTTH